MRRPLLALLALLVLLLLCARLALRRFVVQDTSMQPTLRPTDRLLVFRSWRVSHGDVVVLHDPEQLSKYLVKRVGRVEPNGDLVLHADNPNVSRDSRHFGAVPRRLNVGRVIYRYLPAERRGWLTSRR